jgi:predicted N-acyltransferase
MMTSVAAGPGHQPRTVPAGSLVGETVDSLSSLAPEEWDAIDGSVSAALSHGYLTAWEQAELSGLRSRPVIVRTRDRESHVAACPGYFYDLDLVGVRFPRGEEILRGVRRLFPALLYARTYELGSPTPLTRPFLIGDDVLRARAVEALVSAAVEEGRRRKASFLLLQNFTARGGPVAADLKRLGFVPVPIMPTAVVDLPYASFEDYLGAMRAQYRRRARQAFKRSDGLRVESHERFDELAEELARLWRLIYNRAREVKREILTPAYFEAVSALPESNVLVLRRPDESVAAFALLLLDGPWLSFLQCGFEAEEARLKGIYFRLLYEIIRFGIERGFQQVDLGITTLDPKLDVGGVPVPLFAWLRHRNAMIQRLLQALADRLMTPASVESRHVFKESPASAQELLSRRGLPARSG